MEQAFKRVDEDSKSEEPVQGKLKEDPAAL